MGKLVKFCSECEEGFAERFGFCPNCGGQLEAFEMKPIERETATEESPVETASETVEAASAAVVPETLDFSDDDILELDAVDTRETAAVEPVEQESEEETETLAETAPALSANEEVLETENLAGKPNFYREDVDNEYHVTVVSQKASDWFAPFFMILLAVGFVGLIAAYIMGIMIQNLRIPTLGDSDFAYSVFTDDPAQTEEEENILKEKSKGGGGGGGGSENPDPASKGRLPTHNDKTFLMVLPRKEDASMPIYTGVPNQTKREDNGDRLGIGDAEKASGGSGTRGGIGTGDNGGFGSGQNPGEGSGRNGGRGGGSNGGIGDNNGNRLDGDDDEPRMENKNVGVNSPLKITSKPTARYTNEARQANFTGTVRLRVTFNANGTIGSIVPVNSVGYGLTEQAIAAARQMRFEPQVKNGQKVATTRVVEYSFTLY